MSHLAAFLIGLVLWLPLAALNGWAVHVLWAWFAVPLGAPAVTHGQAIGLALLVSYMTHVMRPESDDDEPVKAILTRAVWHTAKALMSVGAGWVYLRVFA